MPKLGRVMIVDDEEIDRMISERIIKRVDPTAEVVCFSRGEDALHFLATPEEQPVHVILSDINMPEMSGFEFVDAVAERVGGKDTAPKVFMLTSALAPKDEGRAESPHLIHGFLTKPLKHKDLVDISQGQSPDQSAGMEFSTSDYVK